MTINGEDGDRQSDNGVEPTAVTVEPLESFVARLAGRVKLKLASCQGWWLAPVLGITERVALIAVIYG